MADDMKASLDAFFNRKIHTELDVPTLRSIADEDLEQAIVDYALSKLDGQWDHEVEIVGSFAPGVRATLLTWAVEADVNNGGFNQYYFNTNGTFAVPAVEAFEYFGAVQHAAVMREANDIHSREAAEMAMFNEQGTLEAFSESYEHTELELADDHFYAVTENLSQLRIARIRRTPEEFVSKSQ